MRLYNGEQQNPKWKDPRTSNVETQAQVYVDELGVKEGTRSGRSCKSRLYGLDS